MKKLRIKKIISRESGLTLLETAVALAILGTIAVTFLSGLSSTSKTRVVADEQVTGESLARAQMEWVKKANYVTDANTYAAAQLPADHSYVNYSANITAQPLQQPDTGIQKITITVSCANTVVYKLEDYKVNR